MMEKSVSKNYLYNLGYQLLTLLTPFLVIPYLSRVLGAEGIGAYSYTLSIAAYFILLANLGTTDYAQREVAYQTGQRRAQSRIFWETWLLRAALTVLSLALYYGLVERMAASSLIYWVQALNIVAVLFDVTWFFQGLEEFGKIVLRNFFVRLLNVALVFLLIHGTEDLLLYVALMGAMNLLSGLLMWLSLPRYLVRVPIGEIRPWRNFGTVLSLFLPQMAIQLYTVLDKTMIGVLTGSLLENGYYEQAEKVVKMPLLAMTALGTVMIPRIASLHAAGDKKAIESHIMRSYRFVWMLALPMAVGLAGTISYVTPWFFGPGFEKVGPLVRMMSGMVIAIGLSNVTGLQYLLAVNRQHQLTISCLMGAAVNFLLNWWLIPTFLSEGAAVASLLAEVTVVTVQFWFVRKIFPAPAVLRLAWPYLRGSFVMGGVLWLLGTGLGLSKTAGSAIFLIFVGVFVYGGLLYRWKDPFFLQFVQRVSFWR